MPAQQQQQFLVRDGRSGKMLGNVLAFTAKGAVKAYLAKCSRLCTDIVMVKPRLAGDWEAYQVK